MVAMGTAAANLDLEDERTEGRTAAAAMPQLINALAAIVFQRDFSQIFLFFFKVRNMKCEVGGEDE